MSQLVSATSRSSRWSAWPITGILALWLAFTVLQSAILAGVYKDPLATLLSFIPGILGIALLLRVGFTREELFLRLGRISRASLLLYATLLLVSFTIVLPTGVYTGWNPLAALVYAPASAINQELFFRCALLPVFLRAFKGKTWMAIVFHSLLFGLWHIGVYFSGAPLASVLMVMFIPFVFGLAWGWQAQHDRTVIWAILYHSLLLFLNSFYTWG
jgi:hypothetical protein